MKRWLAVCGVLVLAVYVVSAQSLYKCEVNGVTSYQAEPCEDGGGEIEIKVDKPSKSVVKTFQDYIPGLSIGMFHVKREEIDTLGNQWFSCKVTVNNETDFSRKVALQYQALDARGFEIGSVVLFGTVQAQGLSTFTERTYMEYERYERIYQWVLKK